MSVDFSAVQEEFTQHIRNPSLYPVPSDVQPERVAMYRTLIFNNIEGFLATNFPVIRTLLADSVWQDLVQDFFSTHTCHTPYFSEIAEEFITYLETERSNPDDYPFLLELAHYEWVEMALSIAKDEVVITSQPKKNLLDCTVRLSPLALPLVYQYPVHLISPDHLPNQPADQPTCLIVYRDIDDEVKFIIITALTYRMLEIIQEQENTRVSDCLNQLIQESGHSNPTIILNGGLQILAELVEKQIIQQY